jgi:hypothetical protein
MENVASVFAKSIFAKKTSSRLIPKRSKERFAVDLIEKKSYGNKKMFGYKIVTSLGESYKEAIVTHKAPLSEKEAASLLYSRLPVQFRYRVKMHHVEAISAEEMRAQSRRVAENDTAPSHTPEQSEE